MMLSLEEHVPHTGKIINDSKPREEQTQRGRRESGRTKGENPRFFLLPVRPGMHEEVL